MATIAAIISVVTDANIREIKDGSVVTLDLTKVPADKLELLVKMAMHCAMNGPVGVKTATKWPFSGEEELSIKGHCSYMTTGVWKQFCRIVAQELSTKHAELIKGCYTIKFGGLWPFCDATFIKKVRDQDDKRRR